MTTFVSLQPTDLAAAAVLVLALAGSTLLLQLNLARRLVIAAVRTTIQLSLIGLVLKWLFEAAHPFWLLPMALVMLLVAGREVTSRQRYRAKGLGGFAIGTLSMFISAFTVTLLALNVIIGNEPWYQPQYAIPLLGMLLGNTMNGIALSLERLHSQAWQQRTVIEARLMLGQRWSEAIRDYRAEAMRIGMIPMINAMAAAGIVSLPGMMTGQILAGAPPMEAVKYQILIMFLITSGTGFGTLCAVWFGSRRLFDERERLRLDRLVEGGR